VNLAEAAGAFRRVAERAEEGLARECAQAAAREFLAALDVTTPVLSGDLRRSMHTFSVSGGGTRAVAVVGSDLIYAAFRNYGGTITSKGPWPLRNRATGQVFGRSVTQHGAHYMESAEGLAEGPIRAAVAIAADDMFRI